VFFVIIPGQKKMVAAIRAGEEVDPQPGIDGKQRSVHNTYFTLPVLFTMVSNHYAVTYGHEYNWLVLIALSLAGALIRVFFVSRHGEGSTNYTALVIGIAMLVVASVMLAPKHKQPQASNTVSFTEIEAIIDTRCAVCHSATPTQAGFVSPPKGVVYDSAQDIQSQAALIHQQAVVTKVMPIGNLSAMTDAERDKINSWFMQLESNDK
jgi:uncharacterized membrane protein